MLQQTQVARVADRYDSFLRRFPTPAACAASSARDVIRAWDGLGYNRRAVDLHRAAMTIVAEHGGAVPRRLSDLLALPGVGPKSAQRIAFHLLTVEVADADRLIAAAHDGREVDGEMYLRSDRKSPIISSTTLA